MSHLARAISLLSFSVFVSGCGVTHIGAYVPKEREYKQGKYAQKDPSAQPTQGSLFSEAVGGYLEDTRAVRVGDLVLVRIDESADASGDSTTQLSRDSSSDMGFNAFGLADAIKAAKPGLDPTHILQLMAKADFNGNGNTSRKGQLKGSIAVRVTRAMPNGDMFLEGTKVILLNNEEYHLYISGLIRRTDIEQDNSVLSSRIADAEVEFTGRGDIADQQRKGILGRVLDKVQPF